MVGWALKPSVSGCKARTFFFETAVPGCQVQHTHRHLHSRDRDYMISAPYFLFYCNASDSPQDRMPHVRLHFPECVSLAGGDWHAPNPGHHHHAIPPVHRQWYFAGRGILANSWLVSVGFFSSKPSRLSVSTVINDFCLCDLLAHSAEQWGIPGHGKSPTCEPPGNESRSSFGAPTVHRHHLGAKAQSMSAQGRSLFFPGTASPLPESQSTVGKCPAP